ncbi:MAG: hypothetical protein EXX96DRAFT_648985 [Benjaminiella poitrasii]|nr:MAG: hypothetical protein EXX96DRAFT_648985 [Benjaminiella poitrasii]
MSPEMLMQPFEQSFSIVPMFNSYYPTANNNHSEAEEQNNYFLDYTQHPDMDPNGNFRTTFYNPFEIKHRRRTSRAQLKVLEKSFLENPKPNATVRRILAQQLDMTPRGVQIWFQNRRAKAKLQRHKSGENGDSANQQQHQEQEQQNQEQHESPVFFSQFFNNMKNWNNNARSVAAAAAVTCMLDPSSNDNSNFLLNQQQQASTGNKMDEWFKMPIHPLAPVIDGTEDFCIPFSSEMSSDEWRRKSCPVLGSKNMQQGAFGTVCQQSTPWPLSNNSHLMTERRPTADDIHNGSVTRFNQAIGMTKSPSSCEYGTPKWNNIATPTSSSLELYSNFNYSPMSQQLTPMLSTGSPVSSIDGGYYDSCFDLLMGSSSNTSSM